ncbi:hypothetical protein L226DRAFT_467615 [Lentinus tigrinus ALCF2SS1-7]|uniref:Uncharacterized protein n=1 Tax=Lentinus tigrinus ALCF2SS1-6 TaxID=1328759 RepID=A0A5C2S1V4_9APHY|nr:hypothetical protein L227DRAFT_506920 [Lentinus tigrinus ALCF2SS1-6]RPD72103.1 hypothetical protein L226DRAFT_467615 [Lentinus tigrinus ALCF2SS1-7]
MNPPRRDPDVKDPEAGVLLEPLQPGLSNYYYAAYQPPIGILYEDRPRTSRRRRFWHLFACTFLAFVALYLLLPSVISHKKLGRDTWYRYTSADCSDYANWTAIDADPHDKYPYRARTTMTLPLSAKELSFVSGGSFQYGDFELSQSADAVSDKVIVEIKVSFQDKQNFDRSKVCRYNPQKDHWGVGIFTPSTWNPYNERNMKFHIHVHLPAIKGAAPLQLEQFGTNLLLFAHHIHDISHSTYFEHFRLRTSDRPLVADSLTGNRIYIESANGPISGTFNASSMIRLETSNAPIKVATGLVSSDTLMPSILWVGTSNGRVENDVTLRSNTSDGTKGTFHVTTRTENAPLYLTFVEAPIDSSLTVNAHTSNSPGHVTLHKTYEGTFDASSTLIFRPEVRWSPAEDPSGRGARRVVRFDENTMKGPHVSGGVSWTYGGEDKGRVAVETSNSPFRLDLSYIPQ